jgi:hypothetical protein
VCRLIMHKMQSFYGTALYSATPKLITVGHKQAAPRPLAFETVRPVSSKT